MELKLLPNDLVDFLQKTITRQSLEKECAWTGEQKFLLSFQAEHFLLFKVLYEKLIEDSQLTRETVILCVQFNAKKNKKRQIYYET